MTVRTMTAAGVRLRRRWLLRHLDVTLEPGETAVIVGPPGTGRTTLLLTLAARFRLAAGRHTDAVLALGHVPGVYEPEPGLTVAEHLRERLVLLGKDHLSTLDVERYGLDPVLLGGQLSAYQRQLLGLALAGLSAPALIALDGLDDGLDACEQAVVRRILGGLAAAGTAVLVTASAVDPDLNWTVLPIC